jgi:hypothetical protein
MNKISLQRRFALNAVALGLSLAFGSAHAQINEAQLVQRLDALAAELDKVKAELAQMKVKADVAPVPSAAPAMASNHAPAPSPTQLSAYGEINYTRPGKDSSAAQTNITRFVIGYQHRFDEKTKVVAELEVENAVASSSDSGEVAVEQVFVEHRLNDTHGLRAGLFLMPIGLVNQNHEPHTFFGVNRPTVETAIIPSTLREVGLQMFGEHDNGVSWSAGLSTGPDLTKWDPLNAVAVESPLRTVHQEGQLAKSKDLTLFAAVDWRGIPGLRVGGGLMTGKLGHGSAGFAGNSARYTLMDLHAKWTPGAWDLTALYARASISGAAALNATFAGAPYLVPNAFDGFYAQAAYKLRLSGDYAIAPFARYEIVNTGRGFDGSSKPGYQTESITTVGANFNLTSTVVVKADMQRYKVVSDNNRFNLGLGFSF